MPPPHSPFPVCRQASLAQGGFSPETDVVWGWIPYRGLGVEGMTGVTGRCTECLSPLCPLRARQRCTRSAAGGPKGDQLRGFLFSLLMLHFGSFPDTFLHFLISEFWKWDGQFSAVGVRSIITPQPSMAGGRRTPPPQGTAQALLPRCSLTFCATRCPRKPPTLCPRPPPAASVNRVAESVTQWAEAAAGLCFPEVGAKAGSLGRGAGRALASQSTAAAARGPPLGGGRGRGAEAWPPITPEHFGGSCVAFGQPSLERRPQVHQAPTKPQQ